jgi:DUF1680 family protein
MASFLAGSTGEIRIRIPDSTGTPKSSLNGKPTRLTPEGNFLTVTLQKGDRLEITFS